MHRYGDYDFPAPPPLTEEFECIPLYEQQLPVTVQPERIFSGQSDRPRLPEKTFKSPYYGGKEGQHPSPKQGLLPLQSRDADNRFLRDDSVARVTGQSKTMPRSGQLHHDPIADHAKPISTISSPPPYAAEQSSHGQKTGHDQSSRPPPVAQKPDQRPAFNYLGQPNPTGAGTQRLMYPHLIKPSPRDWSSELCSCCSDMKSCCGVFWCGCLFYPCFLSRKLGEHTCLPCVMGSTCSLISLRTKLRTQSRIEGTICNDCCTVVCCQCCAMCQMSREHDFVTKHHIVK